VKNIYIISQQIYSGNYTQNFTRMVQVLSKTLQKHFGFCLTCLLNAPKYYFVLLPTTRQKPQRHAIVVG